MRFLHAWVEFLFSHIHRQFDPNWRFRPKYSLAYKLASSMAAISVSVTGTSLEKSVIKLISSNLLRRAMDIVVIWWGIVVEDRLVLHVVWETQIVENIHPLSHWNSTLHPIKWWCPLADSNKSQKNKRISSGHSGWLHKNQPFREDPKISHCFHQLFTLSSYCGHFPRSSTEKKGLYVNNTPYLLDKA